MKEISYQIENGIALMQIDRPKALNALSRAIIDEMDCMIDELAADPNVRVLILYSEGNFAAGADISGMAECDPEGARTFGFSPTYNKLEALTIPTIAVIEGYALGGGLELALACDLRIAADNAKMGFPEISLGIMPGAGGTVRAPKLIGPALAKEMILMGGTISAEKAERIGIVNAVLPQAEVMGLAMKWAEKLKRLSAEALKTAKQTVNETCQEPDIAKGVAIEFDHWCEMFRTEDQKEGMRAFLEKRKPEFKGR